MGDNSKGTEGFSYSDWYERNGKELNDRRRSRYKNDPEYRASVLKRNNEIRQRRKRERQKERSAREGAMKVRALPGYKVVQAGTAKIDGASRQLFTIGYLARATGLSVKTLRLWESRGQLPETPHRSAKNDRLYTADQILEFVNLLREQDKLPKARYRVASRKRFHLRGRIRLRDKTLREVVLFRVGALARVVGRSVTSIETLETRGYIPATPFKASSVGQRLYTLEMIEAIKTAFDAAGRIRGEAAWVVFRKQVVEVWRSLGVIGAKLVWREGDAERPAGKKARKPVSKKPSTLVQEVEPEVLVQEVEPIAPVAPVTDESVPYE